MQEKIKIMREPIKDDRNTLSRTDQYFKVKLTFNESKIT